MDGLISALRERFHSLFIVSTNYGHPTVYFLRQLVRSLTKFQHRLHDVTPIHGASWPECHNQ